MAHLNYVVVDVETTGLNHLYDKIIQLAHATYDHTGALVDSGAFFLKGSQITSKTTELTGITQDELDRFGVTDPQGTKEWHRVIWNAKPCAVLGYNIINFDWPFIQTWLQKHHPGKFKHPPVNRLIDVMHEVGNYFGTRKWIKQAEAATKLKILFKEEELHNAIADIKLCWKIYEAMTW